MLINEEHFPGHISNGEEWEYKIDIHGSVHRRLLSRNTNKMQLCNRIYYSKDF
jgi:hypothetical protein